jgi:hypothetical protein
MSLVYGECHPLTLSTMFSLASDYSARGYLAKALYTHEECLDKRCHVQGGYSNLDNALVAASIATIAHLKSKLDGSSSSYTKTSTTTTATTTKNMHHLALN